MGSSGERRSRWRPWQWAGTSVWSGFWVLAGIGSGLDPTSSNSLASGLALAAVLGLAPVLPFWIRWWSEGRRDEVSWRDRRAQRRRERLARAERERIERLPERLREDWRRLEAAHALVLRFADDGWVDAAAVAEVGALADRLERLVAADRETDQLGGSASTVLDDQVRQLTDLLVALADEAVEHQAALTSDVPVPATLAEARERLALTRRAYEDLTWPSNARRRATPGEDGTGSGQQYPSA